MARGDRPRVELPKSPTGIAGFDVITGGGLPTGRPHLGHRPAPAPARACSRSSSWSTALPASMSRGCSWASRGTGAGLLADVGSLGIDLDGLERNGLLLIDTQSMDQEEIDTGEFDLEALMVRVASAVEKVGARRVALDSLEGLFARFRAGRTWFGPS